MLKEIFHKWPIAVLDDDIFHLPSISESKHLNNVMKLKKLLIIETFIFKFVKPKK